MRGDWIKGAAAAALAGAALLGAPAFAQARSEGADAGDSASTRARIAPGDTINGALSPAGDKDWYRATLDAGTYRISLTSAGDGEGALGDPLVRVLNSAGQEIAHDDDSGEGLNSFLEFDAPTRGSYFIEARGFGDDAAGAYALQLVSGDIPGDATTDVVLSTSGDEREGRLSPEGDRDWYALDLTAGQTVRLALNDGTQDGVGDPLMVVYNAAGAEIARDDDGGGSLNSYLEFTAADAGRYFVEARGFSDTAAGTYILTLTPGEIGNTADTAESLDSTFSPRTSQINPAGDSDWFRFDAVEGRSYRIFVDPAEGEGALADPKLTLYDGDGNQIATDDNGGKGKGARIAFIPTHSGSFIAAASAASATESGRYTLRVSDYEVPNGPGTDEVLDEAGDARASRIDMAGDKDWYGFTAAEGGVYQITVVGSGDNPLARPSAALLTDDGVTISMADAARGGRASVTYRAAKEATLYVQVSSVGAGMGDYTVTLTRTNR